ncbi:hypothetical protein [Anaplasma capra]|uniref:hypothetical protein n=1 Tax=Anaplasma capra TaxID=1562740 RepID=UPI0021D605B0|nr:hypothetical protein [Anaplasma capra]
MHVVPSNTLSLRDTLSNSVEKKLLFGAEDRLFATQHPTGIKGAVTAAVGMGIYRTAEVRGVEALGINNLVRRFIDTTGSKLAEVPKNVVTAWVSFCCTPPAERITLHKILQACIEYPPDPQISVTCSHITTSQISTVPPGYQQKSRWWTISKPAEPEAEVCGIHCEEVIQFSVKDGSNVHTPQDVVMTVYYDIRSVKNEIYSEPHVELLNLQFKIAKSSNDAPVCTWSAKSGYKRIFLSRELELIGNASMTGIAKAVSGLHGVTEYVNPALDSALSVGLTYKQKLQQLSDYQEVHKRANETRLTALEGERVRIKLKDVECLSGTQTSCQQIFANARDDSNVLHSLVRAVADLGSGDRGITTVSHFQKISLKVPARTDDAEQYRVIEHCVIHMPLTSHDFHASLSYTVTKSEMGAEKECRIRIDGAKLGIRHVRMGFELHNCAWAHYRTTDFTTFAVPNLEHVYMKDALPYYWQQAVDHRIIVSPYPKVSAPKQQYTRGAAERQAESAVTRMDREPRHKYAAQTQQAPEEGSTTKFEDGAHHKKPSEDHEPKVLADGHDVLEYQEAKRYGETALEDKSAEKRRSWANNIVKHAAVSDTQTNGESFESHITQFVKSHKQRQKTTTAYGVPKVPYPGNTFGKLPNADASSSGLREVRQHHRKPEPQDKKREQPQQKTIVWYLKSFVLTILKIFQRFLELILRLLSLCSTEPSTQTSENNSESKTDEINAQHKGSVQKSVKQRGEGKDNTGTKPGFFQKIKAWLTTRAENLTKTEPSATLTTSGSQEQAQSTESTEASPDVLVSQDTQQHTASPDQTMQENTATGDATLSQDDSEQEDQQLSTDRGSPSTILTDPNASALSSYLNQSIMYPV